MDLHFFWCACQLVPRVIDSPRVQTYDINTSDEADTSTTPPTPPGSTYRPLRYTTSVRDEIRVGVWLQLSTWLGTYRMDTTDGLDVEALLDPRSTDAERSATVAELVLSYTGVEVITDGPTVTFADGLISISVEADTVDGPIELAA